MQTVRGTLLKNFEDHTVQLSEEDERLAEYIARGLRSRVGQENAIPNSRMRRELRKKGYEISGSKMRKLIQYIRINGLAPLLVASQHGYYTARTVQELEDYIKSFEGRLNSMRMTAEQLKIQASYVRGVKE